PCASAGCDNRSLIVSIGALLAVVSAIGAACLCIGVPRLVGEDMRWLDLRLRQYGARPFELTEQEQKQAASIQVTQLLAQRLEASVSGRTFAAALRTDLARANLRLSVGEFLIVQASSAVIVGAFAYLIPGTAFVGLLFGIFGWLLPRFWLGRRQAGRLTAFNDQLADSISLMSNSL